MLACTWMPSPVGRLQLVGSDAGLAGVLWDGDTRRWTHLRALHEADHPVLTEAARQLREYFAGSRRQFSVRLDLRGTPFQQTVWAALLDIPFGQTRSYGGIARRIGRPGAVRAVGAATGMNPVAVIAPCHRVLGADGTLTGFAGGLAAKRALLSVERIPHRSSSKHPPPSAQRTLDLAGAAGPGA